MTFQMNIEEIINNDNFSISEKLAKLSDLGEKYRQKIEQVKKEILHAMAENTILFIDEAHNAPEAIIQDLLSPMTEYKKLTCFFAVYPEKKEEFLSKDTGLRDRCNIYP